jgi:hypothetical protein
MTNMDQFGCQVVGGPDLSHIIQLNPTFVVI